MALAAAAGHRVVLVTATRGEQGEPQPGVLEEGEELGQRREKELAESCQVLGADPPIFLGYEDSGMVDESTNENPDCFWQADQQEAAERLAAVLREVEANVLTVYDDHGLYGHPDHIQVHKVGLAAAQLAEVPHVYEATVNRDRALASMEELGPMLEEADVEGPSADDFSEIGLPENDLSFMIDISSVITKKRAALAAHKSQISEQSFFLALPDEVFSQMFAWEWFAIPGQTGTGGPEEVELLPGL